MRGNEEITLGGIVIATGIFFVLEFIFCGPASKGTLAYVACFFK